MQPGQQQPLTAPQGRIPYYKLRGVIEGTYNRPRQLLIGCVFGGLAEALLGLSLWLNPNVYTPYLEPWYMGLMVIFVLLLVLWLAGVIATVGCFVTGVLADALSYSDREEERVKKCLEFLEERNYLPETLTAIEAMATHGVASSQIFTVLPVAILTATATIAVITNLPFLGGVILGELAGLALLSFVLSLGQANADVVIQKTLVEWHRRNHS